MDFKKILPHIIAVVAMLAVAAIFYAPNAFNGKALQQGDNERARGMAAEITDYLKKEGTTPLWTNSGFGGMPSYQIYMYDNNQIVRSASRALFLGQDISAVWAQTFAAMFMAYLLLTVLGADWRLGLFGGIAYGITTYNVDILEAGHSTKMMALAIMPGMLAGVALIFRKNYGIGTGLLALTTAMQLAVNHFQITYYTLLLIGIWFVAMAFSAFKRGELTAIVLAAGLVGVGLGTGLAANLGKIWPTYEYSKETIRGKSELKEGQSRGDGLTKDYLFGWSYGVGESLTLLVPRYAGGGANESVGDTKMYKAVSRQVPPDMTRAQIEQQVAALLYTGDQPFVGTAIYMGAIVLFLAFLGAFLAKGPEKWWLFVGGLFMLSLAWGKNFFLNDIWYDVLPMFKKFRAVSMAMGVVQLCAVGLGVLGLQRFFSAEALRAEKQRALLYALGTTALLAILALATVSTSGQNDNQLDASLVRLLAEDRSDRSRADVFRSLGFVLVAAGLLWFYLQGRLKAAYAVVALLVFSLADNWLICRRTLQPEKYVAKKEALGTPPMTGYDQEIKQDPDIHYRVLDLARGSLTGNGITSYFHKSISGFHAAKLQRYQDVIDRYFEGNGIMRSQRILGMLNTKYIVRPEGAVVKNLDACGHAWFAKHLQVLPDADSELTALGTLNTKDSAIVQQAYSAPLQGIDFSKIDPAATIQLSHYHPDRMTYLYTSATDQLAVFSEIYYPESKGWNVYVNGQRYAGLTKVNYLLRGIKLPPGKDVKLEMRFEPKSYLVGSTVSMVASALAFLAFVFGLFWQFRRGSFSDVNRLVDTEPVVSNEPTRTSKTSAAPAAPPKRRK